MAELLAGRLGAGRAGFYSVDGMGTAKQCRGHRSPTRVGLIADTHGLVRPEALAALAGVAHILHAGDVGKAEVLEALRGIAPVTAVRGNVDHGAWADALPDATCAELGGARIHVLHDLKQLPTGFATGAYAAVVAGHSHRPAVEARDGTTFVNPGIAGPRRFHLPVTLALLELVGHRQQLERHRRQRATSHC